MANHSSDDGQPSQLKAIDYTLGWICALPVELAAALQMLDEEHSPPFLDFATSSIDDNQYCYGKIGAHNVVITCLPKGQIGNNVAAAVAGQMRTHFPALRFALMVGIGGGAPSEDADIRLGDVVISVPEGQSPGVIQYDMGKAVTGGNFERTGALSPPPPALLQVVTKLEANHLQGKAKLSTILAKFDELPDFTHPGTDSDTLYEPEYEHSPAKAKNCRQCDQARTVERDVRETTAPCVHYGTIASGNLVIKDAKTRDTMSETLGGVLGFEMEAAGLMSTFPCLIIRGICDYSDSHKNKKWQPYAAATAAACAKELLFELAPSMVARSKTLEQVLEATRGMKRKLDQLTDHHNDKERKKLCAWISNVSNIAEQNDLWRIHKNGTSAWMFQHPEFSTWLAEPGRIVFCPGDPGAGKTMIACAVIEHLRAKFSGHSSTGICYVYCSYTNHAKHTLDSFLASMLEQLIRAAAEVPRNLKDLYKKHARNGTKPNTSEYVNHIIDIMGKSSRSFLVVDALDECSDENGIRKNLIQTIFELQHKSGANIFATSRFITEICDSFVGYPQIPIRAHEEDIRIYLDQCLLELPQGVLSNSELQEEVKSAIVEAADGIFLLAKLQFRSLTDMLTARAVRDALKSLSKGFEGLKEAYESAKIRINNRGEALRNVTKRILSWITYVTIPLTITELLHALAVIESDTEFDESNVMRPEDVVRLCEGLVAVDQERQTVRFVHYTVQEYFSQICSSWLPGGHEMIVQTCLQYLTLNSVLNSTNTCNGFIEQFQAHPFLSWAANFWGYHAQHVDLKETSLISTILNHAGKLAQILQMVNSNGSWHRSEYAADILDRDELMECINTPWTAFHLAAWFDLQEVTAELLNRAEFSPNLMDSESLTPLALATHRNCTRVAELLIASSTVNVSWVDCFQRTLLHLAVRENNARVVQALLRRKDINPNLGDMWGLTPLQTAIETNSEMAMQASLAAGSVDVNAAGAGDLTPLSYAAVLGPCDLVAAILKRQDLNINMTDIIGRTALALAVEQRHESIVKLLLSDSRIEVDIQDPSGWTPFQTAVKYGYESIVKVFVDSNKVDLQARADRLRTPLMIASSNNHDFIVLLLLNQPNIGINARDSDRKTALMLAACKGHISVVKHLVEKGGANIHLKDRCRQTAAKCAALNGHKAVKEWLSSVKTSK